MDFSDNDLYDGLDNTNGTNELKDNEGSQNASDQDFNLFEECIISKEKEKEAKKWAELTSKWEEAEKEKCALKERCRLLEEDNRTLLKNISSLWKTAIAQLRNKDKKLVALQKEKEGIIFRRVMRQIPKDEFDRVVSRIAAYDKSEVAELMKTLNQNVEVRNNPAGPGFPKAKYKKDHMVKKTVLGSRVKERYNTDALRLQRLQGKRKSDFHAVGNNLKISSTEGGYTDAGQCSSKGNDEGEGVQGHLKVADLRDEKSRDGYDDCNDDDKKQHEERKSNGLAKSQDHPLEEGEIISDTSSGPNEKFCNETDEKKSAANQEAINCPANTIKECFVPGDPIQGSNSGGDIRAWKIPRLKAKSQDEKENKIRDYRKRGTPCSERDKEDSQRQHKPKCKTLAERNEIHPPMETLSGGGRKRSSERRTSSHSSARDDAKTKSSSPRDVESRSQRHLERRKEDDRRSRTHSHDSDRKEKLPYKKDYSGGKKGSRSERRDWDTETSFLVEKLRERKIRENVHHKRSFSRQPHHSIYKMRRKKREIEEFYFREFEKYKREKYKTRKETGNKDKYRTSKEINEKDSQYRDRRDRLPNDERKRESNCRSSSSGRKGRSPRELTKEKVELEGKRTDHESKRKTEEKNFQGKSTKERDSEDRRKNKSSESSKEKSKSLERNRDSRSNAMEKENTSRKEYISRDRGTSRKRKSDDKNNDNENIEEKLAEERLAVVNNQHYHFTENLTKSCGLRRNPNTDKKLSEAREVREEVDKELGIEVQNSDGFQGNVMDRKCSRPSFRGALSLPEINSRGTADGLSSSYSFSEKGNEEEVYEEGDTLDNLLQTHKAKYPVSLTIQNDDSEMSLLRFIDNRQQQSPDKSSSFVAISPPPFVMPSLNSPLKSFCNLNLIKQESVPSSHPTSIESASDERNVEEGYQQSEDGPPQLARADHLSPVCFIPSQNNFTAPTPLVGRLPYSLKTFQEMETPPKSLSTSSCSPIPVATPLDSASDMTATCTPPPLSSTLKSSTPVVVFDLEKKSCFARNTLPTHKVGDRGSLLSNKVMPDLFFIQHSSRAAHSEIAKASNSNSNSNEGNAESDQNLMPEHLMATTSMNDESNSSQSRSYSRDENGRAVKKKKVPFFTISREVSRSGNLIPNSEEYKALGYASSFFKNLDKFEQEWPSRKKYTHSSQTESNHEPRDILSSEEISREKVAPAELLPEEGSYAAVSNAEILSDSSQAKILPNEVFSYAEALPEEAVSYAEILPEEAVTHTQIIPEEVLSAESLPSVVSSTVISSEVSKSSPVFTSLSKSVSSSTHSNSSSSSSSGSSSSSDSNSSSSSSSSTGSSSENKTTSTNTSSSSTSQTSFVNSISKSPKAEETRQPSYSEATEKDSEKCSSNIFSPLSQHHSGYESDTAKSCPLEKSAVEFSPVKISEETNSPWKKSTANVGHGKKSPAKSSPLKKPPTKSSPEKKSQTISISPVKKYPTRSSPVKRHPTKSDSVEKSPNKSIPVKKPSTRSDPVKKSPIKSSPAKKYPSRSTSLKKSPCRSTSLKESIDNNNLAVKCSPFKKSTSNSKKSTVELDSWKESIQKVTVTSPSSKRRRIKLTLVLNDTVDNVCGSNYANISSNSISGSEASVSRDSFQFQKDLPPKNELSLSRSKSRKNNRDLVTGPEDDSVNVGLNRNVDPLLHDHPSSKHYDQEEVTYEASSKEASQSQSLESSTSESSALSRDNSPDVKRTAEDKNNSTLDKSSDVISSSEEGDLNDVESQSYERSVEESTDQSGLQKASRMTESSEVEDSVLSPTKSSTVRQKASNVRSWRITPTTTPIQNRRTPPSSIKVITPEGVCIRKASRFTRSRSLTPSSPCNVISIVYSGKDEEEPMASTSYNRESTLTSSNKASSKRVLTRSSRKRKRTSVSTKPSNKKPGDLQTTNTCGPLGESAGDSEPKNNPKNDEVPTPLTSQVIIRPIKRRKVNLRPSSTSSVSVRK